MRSGASAQMALTDTVGHGIQAFARRQVGRLVGVALFAVVAFGVASLATWNVADPSFSHATDTIVTNAMGYPGAVFSDLAMQFFGLSAVAALVPAVIWGFLLFSARGVDKLAKRGLAWFGFALVAAAIAGCVVPPKTWPLPTGLGGVFGDMVLHVPGLFVGGYPTGTIASVLAVLFVAPALWFFAYGSALTARKNGFAVMEPEAAEQPKFTQRLTPEGKEIDPGPAGGESSIGEGTSVVALTTQPSGPAPADPPAEVATPEPDAVANDPATPPATENAPAPEATQPALAVGQKAIFYEERTSTAEGSAEPGNIVWSLVQESPGGEAPPEPAIRAEANIPGKNIQLRMTIRRNTDETLPASHIVELIFLTPEGFEGGGIDNILRIAMKTSEQDAGSPLIGIPAKIADGFFLVALNDTKADEQANLTLLRNQDWIDIPIIYKSGRRALITMEKGIPGDKVFDDALKAWQEKSAG